MFYPVRKREVQIMALHLILICRSRSMSVLFSIFLSLQILAIVSVFARIMSQAADHGCLVLPHHRS